MKNVAIILAGGSGSRFKNSIPKQFLYLNDKRVIDYCISTFKNHKDIHEIITDPRYGVIHENPEMAKKQSKKQLANMAKGLVPPGVKTLLRKFPRIKIG